MVSRRSIMKSSSHELALEGSRTALRFASGHRVTQEFLGLAYLDLEQLQPARNSFSQALYVAPPAVTLGRVVRRRTRVGGAWRTVGSQRLAAALRAAARSNRR